MHASIYLFIYLFTLLETFFDSWCVCQQLFGTTMHDLKKIDSPNHCLSNFISILLCIVVTEKRRYSWHMKQKQKCLLPGLANISQSWQHFQSTFSVYDIWKPLYELRTDTGLSMKEIFFLPITGLKHSSSSNDSSDLNPPETIDNGHFYSTYLLTKKKDTSKYVSITFYRKPYRYLFQLDTAHIKHNIEHR